MSKVRTVAAISTVVGDAVVSGIIIGATEMLIDEISNNCDRLSNTQKIFLKAACWVGAGAVLLTVPVTVGALLRWPHRGV